MSVENTVGNAVRSSMRATPGEPSVGGAEKLGDRKPMRINGLHERSRCALASMARKGTAGAAVEFRTRAEPAFARG